MQNRQYVIKMNQLLALSPPSPWFKSNLACWAFSYMDVCMFSCECPLSFHNLKTCRLGLPLGVTVNAVVCMC